MESTGFAHWLVVLVELVAAFALLLLALVVVAGTIRVKVQRSAQWTHFTSNNQGAGLYVLKDPRHAQAHQHFVEMIKKRIG